MKIAVLANDTRDVTSLAPVIGEKLKKLGADVVSPSCRYNVADNVFLEVFLGGPARGCDALIVLGGDGTLLAASGVACLYDIPLFGVNLGHMGFLSEAEADLDLDKTLERLVAGDYITEKRMMLEIKVFRDDSLFKEYHALNDCVITKSSFEGMVLINVLVNGKPALTYNGDGFIAATPTGASGYSLSAGGPLVSPDMEAVILTPVSAHSLYSRSLVMSAGDEITVTAERPDGECILSIDGKTGSMSLNKDDSVRICKSNLTTTFIRMNDKSFFNVLDEKLRERK